MAEHEPGLRNEPLSTEAQRETFLHAYDEQLRTDAETPSAVSVTLLDTLRLVTFAGGRGFVTYPRPVAEAGTRMAALVPQVLDRYREDPAIERIEWKTRGHDDVPGLHEALLHNGFHAEETESIMVGSGHLLDLAASPPPGVTLRRITAEQDVRAMTAMHDIVFNDSSADEYADALLSRLARHEGMELWVAEAEGRMVGSGRLEPVVHSDFAGIWGGATLEEWRGLGIYRSLLAVRARSALAAGKTLIHSDSTEYSRPILERYGLLKVSTTTPYVWRR